MARRKRTDLIAEARELYVKGWSVSRIARHLGITRQSVMNWRAWDLKTHDNDWDLLRKERMSNSPFAPIETLRNRLQRMIESEPERGDDPGYEDQLLKLTKNIDWLETRLGDNKRMLDALELFGHWCAKKLSPKALSVVAEAVADCIDDLRNDRFGIGAA